MFAKIDKGKEINKYMDIFIYVQKLKGKMNK